eukprot:892136-Rhodomonas_salina.3
MISNIETAILACNHTRLSTANNICVGNTALSTRTQHWYPNARLLARRRTVGGYRAVQRPLPPPPPALSPPVRHVSTGLRVKRIGIYRRHIAERTDPYPYSGATNNVARSPTRRAFTPSWYHRHPLHQYQRGRRRYVLRTRRRYALLCTTRPVGSTAPVLTSRPLITLPSPTMNLRGYEEREYRTRHSRGVGTYARTGIATQGVRQYRTTATGSEHVGTVPVQIGPAISTSWTRSTGLLVV